MGNFKGGKFNDRRGGGGFNRRDSGRDFNRGGGDRHTMHKAICDTCKKDCEVPFRPTSGKPIFCSDCFSKQGGGNSRPSKFGGDRGPRFADKGSDNSKEILKGIKTLNYKLDELIKVLAPKNIGEELEKEYKENKEETPKKASKKKVAAKKAIKKKASAKKVVKKKTPKKKPVAEKPTKKKKK